MTPHEVAEALVACALVGVDTDGELEIRRSGVVPAAIAWDDCQCGQLVISEVRRFPSREFPLEEVDHQEHCGEPWIVVEYIMSLTRCVPISSASGQAPTMAQLGTAAFQLSKDMTDLRRAVYCCLQALYDDLGDETIDAFQLGAQPTIGPEGGCAGSELTVLVGWTNDCGC